MSALFGQILFTVLFVQWVWVFFVPNTSCTDSSDISCKLASNARPCVCVWSLDVCIVNTLPLSLKFALFSIFRMQISMPLRLVFVVMLLRLMQNSCRYGLFQAAAHCLPDQDVNVGFWKKQKWSNTAPSNRIGVGGVGFRSYYTNRRAFLTDWSWLMSYNVISLILRQQVSSLSVP